MNKKAFPYWQKTCVMITRRCNLKCRGCNVINYQSAYELTTEEWYKAFDIMKSYGCGFVVLFGGEPTLREDLPEMIQHLNKINMPHTIITNSIRLLKDRDYYDRLIEAKPFGISCSLNEISHDKIEFGDEVKSARGYQLIQNVRRDLPNCDCVANMAVTRDNILRLPEIVQWLTDNKIWVIMTFIHLCDPHESSYWWYRGPSDESNIKLKLTEKDIPDIRKTANWFKKHYNDLLLHNEKSYFDRWDNECLYQNWKCHNFVNPNINPDGIIMACIDRPLTTAINILDLPEREKELLDSFYDSIKYCTCAWDHMISCNLYAKQGKPDFGKKVFAHKQRSC